jgi:hypothetical protein
MSLKEVGSEPIRGNTDNSAFLDVEERLMTPAEELEQDERIEQSKSRLGTSRIEHENWTEEMTKRRMFALARLRTLQRTRRKRFVFYENMKELISESGTSSPETISTSSSG